MSCKDAAPHCVHTLHCKPLLWNYNFRETLQWNWLYLSYELIVVALLQEDVIAPCEGYQVHHICRRQSGTWVCEMYSWACDRHSQNGLSELLWIHSGHNNIIIFKQPWLFAVASQLLLWCIRTLMHGCACSLAVWSLWDVPWINGMESHSVWGTWPGISIRHINAGVQVWRCATVLTWARLPQKWRYRFRNIDTLWSKCQLMTTLCKELAASWCVKQWWHHSATCGCRSPGATNQRKWQQTEAAGC